MRKSKDVEGRACPAKRIWVEGWEWWEVVRMERERRRSVRGMCSCMFEYAGGSGEWNSKIISVEKEVAIQMSPPIILFGTFRGRGDR